MTDQDWLANLKVGDKVVVITPNETYTFEEITRTTKTLVECLYGKFLRSTGYEYGTSSSWHSTKIYQPKPENYAWIDEKIRGQKADFWWRAFVNDRKFHTFDIGRKEKFQAMVEEFMKGTDQ
jgi:hypothetical protein